MLAPHRQYLLADDRVVIGVPDAQQLDHKCLPRSFPLDSRVEVALELFEGTQANVLHDRVLQHERLLPDALGQRFQQCRLRVEIVIGRPLGNL